MDTVLEINSLVKYFGDICAVDNISFKIPAGICFGLIGPNGAGKTTTIEMIEGIIKPTSGTILYKGKKKNSSFKEEIGIQFQNTELPLFLTVKETLATFRNLYNKKAEMDNLIETCNLAEILKRDNRKISGGQKQRLLLAIALANDPDLIFLDEPTTGLDPSARRHLWEIIKNLKSQNKTIILTTHYMEEVQILCDIIAIMDRGKIISKDYTKKLLKKHCNQTLITLTDKIAPAKLNLIHGKTTISNNKTKIITDSLDMCINSLLNLSIDISSMTVRNENIEDLYLKLTGKNISG
jgi:ABC-2 type transport system ATP-binding protein